MGIIDKIKQKRAEKQQKNRVADFIAHKFYIEYFLPERYIDGSVTETAETIYHPANNKELLKAIEKVNKFFDKHRQKDIKTLKKLALMAMDVKSATPFNGKFLKLVFECDEALKTLGGMSDYEIKVFEKKINLPKTLISECQELAALNRDGKLATASDGSNMPTNIFEMFGSILQDQKTLVEIVQTRKNFLSSGSDYSRKSLENATKAIFNSVGKKYLNVQFYPEQEGTTERWVDTNEYTPEKPKSRLIFSRDKERAKDKSGSEKGNDDKGSEKRP